MNINFANFPIPRLPQALARHQEALPLVVKQNDFSHLISRNVIPLRSMCAKWWLEKVQYHLRKDTDKPKLFSLQRYLQDLPRNVRLAIINNGLKAGGLHLSHESKEIPSINRCLVFLSSDMEVSEVIYISMANLSDKTGVTPDLNFLYRSGEGILKMLLILPDLYSDFHKKCATDLFRTCSKLTQVTIRNANDNVLALLTRYCKGLQSLDVSNSTEVTNEGISRVIVNLKWPDTKPQLYKFDIDKTSVTQDGLMNVLTSLPSVKNFGGVDIVEAIEGIITLVDDTEFECYVEETTLKCATVNRIQTLKKHCPNIHSLVAIFQEPPGATLNDLRLLKNLTHVDIVAIEPFLLTRAQLQEYLWATGMTLKVLKVSGDIFWEADLGFIFGQCPMIQHLSFPAITVPMRETLNVLTAKDSIAFKYLTILEVDCMKGAGPDAWAKDFNLIRRGLVLALKKSLSLKRLILRPTSLVDNDFGEILIENRFCHLEVLELYNSVLSLAFAKILIDTCEKLHVLKGVRTWRGMTLHDVLLLRIHAKGHRRVSDLKIIP